MGDFSQCLIGKQLTELYLCQTPLVDIPWKDCLSLNNIKDQELLLHSTVCHEMCQKFRPKTEYTRKFLKKIIDILETRGVEIYEDLYNQYVKSLDSCKAQSTFSYKSYYLHTIDEFIPMLECSSFLSCGTTGLNTWPGAKILAEWCMHNRDLFTNKQIIELGAGIGLAGIMVTKACLPASYLFTDYHDKVLKILNYNVKLNFDDTALVCDNGDDILSDPLLLPLKYHHHDTAVAIDSIDWTDQSDVSTILKKYGSFDVILAADVVFEPTILFSLVNTIFSIMTKSHQSNKQCVGYFSVVVRNIETFENFYAELNSKSFEVIELNTDFLSYFSNPTHKKDVDIKLLKIVIHAGA